jgi:hypothetical protein
MLMLMMLLEFLHSMGPPGIFTVLCAEVCRNCCWPSLDLHHACQRHAQVGLLVKFLHLQCCNSIGINFIHMLIQAQSTACRLLHALPTSADHNEFPMVCCRLSESLQSVLLVGFVLRLALIWLDRSKWQLPCCPPIW